MITGNKDTDFETLLKLDDKDFFKICAKFNFFKDLEKVKKEDLPKGIKKEDLIPLEFTNRDINKLCNNETLWKTRLFQRYGQFYPEEGQTWKNLYLKLVYYLDKNNYEKNNNSLQKASSKGHLEVVKYLMTLDPKYGIDPSVDNNLSIRFASANGHLEIVKYLISLYPKYSIDPSANNNYAIRWASRNGSLKIIKYLMSLEPKYGIDPSADDNYALMYARLNGHVEVVNYLLSLDPKYGIEL